ncbi:hypothetical protein JCGZ_22901 [Jatropha curcas]|uniref:Uncharacterized protein n=1 Tax=Jatropha curcas TaxID=180498 RepID=A0A067JPH6_JATCU|nr:uncharacterized protein LOC105645397 [Jatropha curcas]XP_012086387.1 uncharacterized protein LOC105645397 [Jatropha curcas]XP_012086388.1 uncharacterized protein LOC105645397 [Jatropha curcas]XP_012086389.1 uncharacterized protein LOC105645397 [Jatropha curcas]KDP25871.1 hypothetical protein JCGZ_22901 [Jatropha curcas]
MFAHRKNKPLSLLYSRVPKSPVISTSLSPKMPPTTTTTTATTTKSLTLRPSRFKDVLLAISLLLILHLLFRAPPPPASDSRAAFTGSTHGQISRRHLLFSIASSASSFPRRASYLRLWYNRSSTRAFAFLDVNSSISNDPTLPPVILSKDTSRFPYSYKGGLRSAIRVARLVKEAVDLDQPDVRWFVFGDDDTVFLVENLVKTLSKYDHDQWYYIGSNSESYVQNVRYSFDMAFGGGGFAISYSLGRVLARVMDSCLVRYAHLYGSDARIFSCLAELGVGLTHEPGFHQVDMRGNLFGMLSAHPLSPLVSLHHLDAVDPLFPSMSKALAAEHLFEAANVDPTRILQQTVCYDSTSRLTVSVAWGYSIQVFEGNELLPDLLSLQRTFRPWRRAANSDNSLYMFNMREYPRDQCKRPLVFFMESVTSGDAGVWSTYTRHGSGDCSRAEAIKNLKRVKVFSHMLEPDIEQMKVLRRQCCDIYPSFNESMVISIRQCGVDELISMDF